MQMWKIESVTDEDAWFRDYLDLVLANAPAELPPKEWKIGVSTARWFETTPGVAFIETTGGTIDDRWLAESIVRDHLGTCHIKQAKYSFDGSSELRKTASWDDIMSKAKRLIQSGQVTLLRNGTNNVVSHVVGDHGEYQSEFSRDDPNSRAITQWQCDCNLPSNPIVMADGTTKLVKDIQTGDLVLTATGHAGVVGRTMSRDYDGKIVGLKIEGSTETAWLTDNHKLITADVEAREAGKWKTGDYSYMPQPQFADQTEINVADFVPGLEEHEGLLYRRNKGYQNKRQRQGSWTTTMYATTQKPIPARIPLDENFARLAGLYVAEGIATPRGELRWSFNQLTEQHLADEVIELLEGYGIDNAKKKNARSCVTVAVQSKPLSLLFIELFGTGSRAKKLAMPIMAMNESALQIFFDAWVEGDGCTNNQNRHHLGTASDNLAQQARLIMARLGKESVLRRQETNASPLVPNGGSINNIAWRPRGGKGQGARWFENEQVTQRMIVEEKHYAGKVYNFEVIGEHSYVIAPGIASANCPWDQYAFQRTRQWKKYEGRPCSHVIATYWKSLSTPVDDADEQAGGQQQMFTPPPAQGLPPPPRLGPNGPPDASQGQQLSIPGFDPSGASGGPGMPSQGVPPAPPPLLPGFPAAPLPPPVPVSVPGAKPASPSNPLQNPGTFSKVAGLTKLWLDDKRQPPDDTWIWAKTAQDAIHTLDSQPIELASLDHDLGMTDRDKFQQYTRGMISEEEAEDNAMTVVTHLLSTKRFPAKIIIHSANEEASEQMRVLLAPHTNVQVKPADEAGWNLDGQAPETKWGGWKFAKKGDVFQNGDMVRLDKEEYGVAEGRSEEHGAGQYVLIPKNSIGEALGTDQTTGWTHCLFTGPMKDNGPMQPWGVSAWIDGSNLTAMPNVRKPGPAVRRR